MSTLYRLKAYFGMVPAEDMDAYLGLEEEPHYYEESRPSYPAPRAPRSDDIDRRVADRYQAPEPSAPVALSVPLGAPSGASVGHGDHLGGGRAPMVHGSLAVEPRRVEPVRASAPPLPETVTRATGAVDSRRLPLSRITTVHPRSYNEARTIGERYRDGIPVIINLTELDDAAAKRLVDFAAGLAFALRGSIDKVTSRVFLLSPAGVEVSAEDRRKLAEGGFFSQD
jgi:cell division inhibitor SepF